VRAPVLQSFPGGAAHRRGETEAEQKPKRTRQQKDPPFVEFLCSPNHGATTPMSAVTAAPAWAALQTGLHSPNTINLRGCQPKLANGPALVSQNGRRPSAPMRPARGVTRRASSRARSPDRATGRNDDRAECRKISAQSCRRKDSRIVTTLNAPGSGSVRIKPGDHHGTQHAEADVFQQGTGHLEQRGTGHTKLTSSIAAANAPGHAAHDSQVQPGCVPTVRGAMTAAAPHASKCDEPAVVVIRRSALSSQPRRFTPGINEAAFPPLSPNESRVVAAPPAAATALAAR